MKATYTGAGNYLNGVPARDLTDEDWDALTPEQKAEVKASGLYELEGLEEEEEEAAEGGSEIPSESEPAAEQPAAGEEAS
jgi:hypothetical protein